ncbi:LA_2272/LA_2273 family lipoprotein [Leptospira adleri]|uniref:PPE family protein n=1 Tax=Leptospira adleri TaxID=2023186 RepID=A0A2M9YM84_9LEPT|nr:hypothetical protein [Leptospira adleri]PJZ52639.1 hypothetical protein CH380_14395 [Leptospira adleri]PJZ59547.1 hypothetical protein CH376_23160 [Leptospira adleri]
MKNKIKPIALLFWLLLWVAVSNCGLALTPRLTTKIPPKTETEFLRLNLIYGEVKTLAGVNVGLLNEVQENLYGAQLGIVNFSEGKTYGFQIAVVNAAKNKGFGIQAGIVNSTNGDSKGIQAGIINLGSDKQGYDLTIGVGNYKTSGLMIGATNLSSQGINIGALNENSSGVNLGALNIQGSGVNIGIFNGGTGVHIGLINSAGEDENEEPTMQFGLLNFCGKGRFPVMIGFNYCK